MGLYTQHEMVSVVRLAFIIYICRKILLRANEKTNTPASMYMGVSKGNSHPFRHMHDFVMDTFVIARSNHLTNHRRGDGAWLLIRKTRVRSRPGDRISIQAKCERPIYVV